MRITAILLTSVLLIFSFMVVAEASGKSWRQPSGQRDTEEREPGARKESEPRARERTPERSTPETREQGDSIPKEPIEFLVRMLTFEGNQGVLDYKVDIMEVTRSSMSNQTRSVRKVMYYLEPIRQLTLKDNIPIYYLDESLFARKMDQVELTRLGDQEVNGVDCFVIRMTPVEEAFSQNVKHYYIAKDDYRKIRIESVRVNLAGHERFMVTDFNYRKVDGRYNLPLNSESRLYDGRDFLMETTTATFMDWHINIGLTAEFLNEKLKDYQLYDIVK